MKLQLQRYRFLRKGEDDFMFEQIFGKKGPMMVKVTGAKEPLLDYDDEVAKAKAGE